MGKNHNPKIHHRRSIRLPAFDYSETGYYFVTICTKGRRCLFGDVFQESMVLNRFGYIVKQRIQEISNQFRRVRFASYIIMPNHVHVIIQMKNERNAVGAQFIAPRVFAQRGVINHAPTVGMIVRALKARCTHDIHSFAPNNDVWQRNYHERIVRSHQELFDTIEYIRNNPRNWMKDPLHS